MFKEGKTMEITRSQVINLLKLNYKRIRKLVNCKVFAATPSEISSDSKTMDITNQMKLPSIFGSNKQILRNSIDSAVKLPTLKKYRCQYELHSNVNENKNVNEMKNNQSNCVSVNSFDR